MLALAACGGAAEPVHDTLILAGTTMGTKWNAAVVDPPAAGKDLQREIQEVLSRVDGLMSTYKTDSELSVFNRCGSVEPQPLSAETVEVVAEALRVAHLSDGAFDPTVLPLVDAWGFGPAGRRAGVPGDQEIERALSQVGWGRLALDRAALTLAKSDPAIQLDLSAVAKGYAVDAAAERLLALGCQDFMVEVGGEVRTAGANARGTPWRIGIEKPELAAAGAGRRAGQVVELSALSLATSGDYRNWREFDGKRYSHTIDPRSGRPVEHALASVSVIAASCMTADALATAIEVLGPEAGWDFVQGQTGVEALLIVRLPDGSFAERFTPGFARLLSDQTSIPGAAPPAGDAPRTAAK